MKRSRKVSAFAILLVAAIVTMLVTACRQEAPLVPAQPVQKPRPTLKVGIAPYQDMAMLMNVKPLHLDEKYGTNLQLVSMAWQDLTPAVASATPSVDVAFASLIQFISQEKALNAGSSDPIVFFYPAYVFRGGAFVTLKKQMPVLTRADLNDRKKVEQFLRYRFAAQKTSSYEMLLSGLARKVGKTLKDVKVVDMGSEDGLLAAVNGSVDATSAGLTQKNEVVRQGGRVVLEMADMGQVDIAGFIARRSTLRAKRTEIEAFVKMWTASCDYTLGDLATKAEYPLAYLRQNSSTRYTAEEFASALSQELLPRSLDDMRVNVLQPGAPYDYRAVMETTTAYYLETGDLKAPPNNIEMQDIK